MPGSHIAADLPRVLSDEVLIFLLILVGDCERSASMSDYDTRFSALGRLYGTEGLNRLKGAHVAVIGLGGVGSWVVEALARTGIGQLTLIDMDEVCLSNVNRQIHAVNATVGRAKAEVLAERIATIAPECEVPC